MSEHFAPPKAMRRALDIDSEMPLRRQARCDEVGAAHDPGRRAIVIMLPPRDPLFLHRA